MVNSFGSIQTSRTLRQQCKQETGSLLECVSTSLTSRLRSWSPTITSIIISGSKDSKCPLISFLNAHVLIFEYSRIQSIFESTARPAFSVRILASAQIAPHGERRIIRPNLQFHIRWTKFARELGSDCIIARRLTVLEHIIRNLDLFLRSTF